MKEKRISFGQGKGSIAHNNREFVADNVDVFRTPDNITFVCQPIGEAYDQLFKESTERYNAKQTRNDRKVHGSYYEHLFGVKPCNTVRTAPTKHKSFYEDLVQIGKREDSGYGTEDFQLVADCLKEYMAKFQERNPNFYVFNAVLHMDEATPHLHIDYKEQRHKADELAEQNAHADAELAEKKAVIESAEKKTAKLVEIDRIEVKKSVFSKKVTLSEEDYDNLVALAQKEIVSVRDSRKMKAERKTLLQKVADLETALNSANTELAGYKEKEKNKGLFSRKQLNEEAKRISKEDQLTRSLQKAMTVIDRYGLRDEYNNTKLNTAQRKTVLE